jgi:hypothetical protein
MADERRGEEPDLDDEQRDVPERCGDERATRRIAVAAREDFRRDRRRREGGDAEPEHGDPERVPRDLAEPACDGGRLLAEGRVRAQQATRGEVAARNDRDRRNTEHHRDGHGPKTDDRPEPRPIASGERVDQRRQQERRDQHQRLKPHRGGGGRPRHEHPVAPVRGLFERAGERE